MISDMHCLGELMSVCRASGRGFYDALSLRIAACLLGVIAVLGCCNVAYALEARLALQALDIHGMPFSKIRFRVKGTKLISLPTDKDGRTRFKLSPQMRPGGRVCLLEVTSRKLIFISPEDGCVVIPSVENPLPVSVVLAKQGDLALLKSRQALISMVSNINAKLVKTVTGESTATQRLAALKVVAKSYGFEPDEVDRAINEWATTPTDSYELGLIELYKRNYSKASVGLQTSVEDRTERFARAKQDLIEANLLLAKTFYEQGEYQKAVFNYREALALTPDDAAILQGLGAALTEIGNFSEAENVYLQALKIREKVLDTTHLKVAETLLALGELYYRQSRYKEAEMLYERALVIYEKAPGTSRLTRAGALNNLAMVFTGQGKFAEAMVLYQRALAINVEAVGGEHLDVAFTLNNLGQLHFLMHDYSAAERLYTRALEILIEKLGSAHPTVAQLLQNLGVLYYETGDMVKAEASLQRALAIQEKMREDIRIATTLSNLVAIYLKQGDSVKAEPYLLRSLALREKALRSDDPDIAASINNLGELYYQKGDYERAEPLFRRALMIFEKALGPENPAVATSLRHLAKLYVSKGEYERSEGLYQRALIIEEKALGPEHSSLVIILDDYADLLSKMHRPNDAAKLKKRAEAIKQKRTN